QTASETGARGLWRISITAFLVLAFISGCSPQKPAAEEQTAAEPARSDEASTPEMAQEPASEFPADDSLTNSLSDAKAVPVSNDIVLPPSLHPTESLLEIIKLANSGANEADLLAAATKADSAFNLGPDEIIYLTDIGVSSRVIRALIERDHFQQGVHPFPGSSSSSFSFSSSTAPAPVPMANADSFPDPTLPQPIPAVATLPAAFSPPIQDAPPVEEPATIAVDDFYDALAPYGTWVDVDGYGRCWQPAVALAEPSWQPYLQRGCWVDSNFGSYWMSDYSWGWAPFHYGRWFQHNTLGWCWMPDDCWGASWVCWRYTDDFCGWAPLPPGAGFVAGTGMTFHGKPVASNFNFNLGSHHFHFVTNKHAGDRHLDRVVASREEARKAFDQSTPATKPPTQHNSPVIAGIPRERIKPGLSSQLQTRQPQAPQTVVHRLVQPVRMEVQRPEISVALPTPNPGLSVPARPVRLQQPTRETIPQAIHVGSLAEANVATPRLEPVYNPPMTATQPSAGPGPSHVPRSTLVVIGSKHAAQMRAAEHTDHSAVGQNKPEQFARAEDAQSSQAIPTKPLQIAAPATVPWWVSNPPQQPAAPAAPAAVHAPHSQPQPEPVHHSVPAPQHQEQPQNPVPAYHPPPASSSTASHDHSATSDKKPR
ncbi:MAG TPA: DUF6600 domain-containing protein, partial [Candidatus Dormibacteraeota bacterium]|nr:DUF6600 domain-containing protein [Candidatus Dormibacteraeota bacterium]